MPTPEEILFDRLRTVEKTAQETTVESEIKGEPERSKPVTLRNLFTHPDAHPIVLDFALQKMFQYEWQRWEAETVWDEVKEVFSSQVSELNKQKIRALQALHTSLMPWQRWQVFEKVGVALNSMLPSPKILQILSLEELYAAVDIMHGIRQEPYSDEVKLYMAATVLEEDVFYVPPPLDFIQLEVSQPEYKCQDCGNTESALFHDGVCSYCSGRLHPEQALSMEPKHELVNKGFGKNVKVVVKYDPTAVAARWNDVKGLKYSEYEKQAHEETMEEVQVQKLLLARDYMNLRRKQLAEQLTTLKSWLRTV